MMWRRRGRREAGEGDWAGWAWRTWVGFRGVGEGEDKIALLQRYTTSVATRAGSCVQIRENIVTNRSEGAAQGRVFTCVAAAGVGVVDLLCE